MDWFWLAIISALLSAFAAITQKKVLFKLSALDFSLIVSFLVLIISIPLFKYVNYSALSSSALIWLFVKAVINGVAFLCVMTALKNLEISRAIPIMGSSPVLVALLAFIFIGERLTGYETIGILLVVFGIYILELKKNESYLTPFSVFIKSKYHKVLLIALILISFSAMLDKFILKEFKLPPMTFLAFQHLFFFIIFLVLWISVNKSINIKPVIQSAGKSTILLVVLIAFITIGYRWFQIEATILAPVGLVISLKRLSVLFAAVIGGKIFNDKDYFRKVIAAILIVAGAMFIIE